MGVYRVAFTSIEQTEPLAGLMSEHKVKVPVVALGGVKGLGDKVLTMIKLVAKDVEGEVVPDCDHFLSEDVQTWCYATFTLSSKEVFIGNFNPKKMALESKLHHSPNLSEHETRHEHQKSLSSEDEGEWPV